MSYVKPDAVLEQMVQAGATKAGLAPRDLLVRGFLSGALLGFATTLAFTATLQTRGDSWARWSSRWASS